MSCSSPVWTGGGAVHMGTTTRHFKEICLELGNPTLGWWLPPPLPVHMLFWLSCMAIYRSSFMRSHLNRGIYKKSPDSGTVFFAYESCCTTSAGNWIGCFQLSGQGLLIYRNMQGFFKSYYGACQIFVRTRNTSQHAHKMHERQLFQTSNKPACCLCTVWVLYTLHLQNTPKHH